MGPFPPCGPQRPWEDNSDFITSALKVGRSSNLLQIRERRNSRQWRNDAKGNRYDAKRQSMLSIMTYSVMATSLHSCDGTLRVSQVSVR